MANQAIYARSGRFVFFPSVNVFFVCDANICASKTHLPFEISGDVFGAIWMI